jgi:hypothetical protein
MKDNIRQHLHTLYLLERIGMQRCENWSPTLRKALWGFSWCTTPTTNLAEGGTHGGGAIILKEFKCVYLR